MEDDEDGKEKGKSGEGGETRGERAKGGRAGGLGAIISVSSTDNKEEDDELERGANSETIEAERSDRYSTKLSANEEPMEDEVEDVKKADEGEEKAKEDSEADRGQEELQEIRAEEDDKGVEDEKRDRLDVGDVSNASRCRRNSFRARAPIVERSKKGETVEAVEKEEEFKKEKMGVTGSVEWAESKAEEGKGENAVSAEFKPSVREAKGAQGAEGEKEERGEAKEGADGF